MEKTHKVSVVSPVYKAAENINELVVEIYKELETITTDFEIILVEDGSPDTSWEKIIEISSKLSNVKGLKLSRNFGQHQAIFAGLANSTGDWVIVMDCDFQDHPRHIPKLYTLALQGNDIVFAKRVNRTDSFIKKTTSAFFYRIFSYLTDSNFDGSIGNYGIYSRKAIMSILAMKEPFKIFSLMARWVGFKTEFLEVAHGQRKQGKSSYSLKKLIDLAFTIVLTYSQKPLRLTIKAGILISFFSILFAVYNIIGYYTGIIQVVGYASIITSIWMIGGITIFTLGILGLYIGKSFEGIKNRPVYIIDKIIDTTHE